jgi:hypothetical protein
MKKKRKQTEAQRMLMRDMFLEKCLAMYSCSPQDVSEHTWDLCEIEEDDLKVIEMADRFERTFE